MADVQKIAKSWSIEMKKGYARLAMLMLLSRESLTGYDIMKIIEKKTMGFWKLTPGGVYPVLKELGEKGYVKGSWDYKGETRKKYYTITEEGIRLLDAALQRQQKLAESLENLLREFAEELSGAEIHLQIKKLGFPLFGENFEKKPASEQIHILKRTRYRLRRVLGFIDEKLDELASTSKGQQIAHLCKCGVPLRIVTGYILGTGKNWKEIRENSKPVYACYRCPGLYIISKGNQNEIQASTLEALKKKHRFLRPEEFEKLATSHI